MKLGRRITYLATGALMVCVLAGGVARAATPEAKTASTSAAKSSDIKTATGGGSVQGYASDSVLQDGTVVQLAGKDANKVAPATAKDLQQMYGVTVDPHELSLTLSDSSLKNEVYVATSGTYSVLVSTQNGPLPLVIM